MHIQQLNVGKRQRVIWYVRFSMQSTQEISIGTLLRLITVLVVPSYSVVSSVCDYTHLGA